MDVGEQRAAGGQVASNPDESTDSGRTPKRRKPKRPELRHPFRAFFARHRTLDLVYRVTIGVIGSGIVIGGLLLIPLPGPGWLIVFAGLAILATEFAWAGRLLDFARAKVRTWTDWVTCQSLLVRAAIALGSLALIAGAVGAYLAAQGVPSWLPLS